MVNQSYGRTREHSANRVLQNSLFLSRQRYAFILILQVFLKKSFNLFFVVCFDFPFVAVILSVCSIFTGNYAVLRRDNINRSGFFVDYFVPGVCFFYNRRYYKDWLLGLHFLLRNIVEMFLGPSYQ